jgi:hypothetical protein
MPSKRPGGAATIWSKFVIWLSSEESRFVGEEKHSSVVKRTDEKR